MIQEIIAMLFIFSGLYLGKFIGQYTKQEIKQGKKYIFFTKSLVLATIAIISFYSAGYLEALYLFLGIFLGYLIKFTELYLGLAVIAAAMFLPPFFLLISSLAFIYFLLQGSLQPFKKISLLFFLPVFLLFLPVPASSLAALSAGLLVSSM